MTNILDFFPKSEHINKPRKTQALVINEIHKAYEEGYKFVLVEAPVGSGKSPIAMTFANWAEDTHLLTPRKSLQDQYYEDFGDSMVLMKGRRAYPCIRWSTSGEMIDVLHDVRTGSVQMPSTSGSSCAAGPCIKSSKAKETCLQTIAAESGLPAEDCKCPYSLAIDTACKNKIVCHNLHSFIFQAHFTGSFQERELMIIDEAHEIQSIVRGFITRQISISKSSLKLPNIPEFHDKESAAEWFSTLRRFVQKDEQYQVFENILNKLKDPSITIPEDTLQVELKTMSAIVARQSYLPESATKEADIPHYDSLEEWADWFETPRFIPKQQEAADEYLEVVASMRTLDTGKFVLDYEETVFGTVKFSFTPISLGDMPNKYLFSYAKKVLMLSGTIYDKGTFCKNLGLNPEDVYYIRIGSSFPKDLRPIYMKNAYMADTSFNGWNNNLEDISEKINKVCSVFHDVKGLIHVPSYKAAQDILYACDNERLFTHSPDDFQQKLTEFFNSDGNGVMISPVCQQGVDFKGDRARFQIITRIPYLNAGDKFVKHMLETKFSWYNYEALVIFGQQIGRVNRSETDFGVTVLMDSRFPRFIMKNRSHLPKWLLDAIIS